MEINIRLGKNFTTQYNKLQAEFGTDIARINGFDDCQLSYTDFIDNFIDEATVADASIDGNSNVSHKDIVTLLSEMPKPHRKLLAFNKIYYEYQKRYGFKNANEWLRMEWMGKLYMHDGDTSTFKHYCFAYDLKDLAEKGLYFLGNNFNAKPPKHLITFVDFVKEFIGYASNRSSGAVGLPNLLPYMYYFWKKDVDSHYLGIGKNNSWTAKDYAKQNFQRFIYAVNQPYVRDGQQSAFTNTSVFDRPYFEALFGGSEFPDGTFMIDYEDEIIEFQKWYMEVMSDIRSENMFTFPVSTISLLRKEGEYDLNSLDAYEDPEFAAWAIRHNMKWSDSNIFQDTSVSSLSNCCRLKSDIRDLGYFNSIGGTALKVGSVKVSTINLARIALDTKSPDEYLEELAYRTLVNVRALDVVRNIIRRDVEKGLLPNFTYGLVDFKHLYNTIGFIGVYETMKKFGYTREDQFGNVYYTDEAAEFGEKIFKTMRKVADDFIKEEGVDYMINTEQIPGESAAAKLMKKDKFFYPDADIYDLPLYGNQFIPLGITTTLPERVRIQAMFDKFCNGGSILHANIDAPFDSFEKALRMTNYIAQQGVTYFAFNTKIQACEDNHAFYGTTCPVCGKPIATEYTRIVGFYTPVKTWSKERTREYGMRRWERINYTAEAI
jgi:ribonucleoside-triphosphate reductase